MTQLLEKAYARIAQLPEQDQNGIASIILDELEDEEEWSRQFAGSANVPALRPAPGDGLA